MTCYLFACPAPCNREIKVDASNTCDAVEKIIMAGAISCRNIDNHCICKQAPFDMSPIPEDQLRRIVSLCMREECDPSPLGVTYDSGRRHSFPGETKYVDNNLGPHDRHGIPSLALRAES
jgi:hypothetical protein